MDSVESFDGIKGKKTRGEKQTMELVGGIYQFKKEYLRQENPAEQQQTTTLKSARDTDRPLMCDKVIYTDSTLERQAIHEKKLSALRTRDQRQSITSLYQLAKRTRKNMMEKEIKNHMDNQISKQFLDFKSQRVKNGTFERKDTQKKFFLEDRQQMLINQIDIEANREINLERKGPVNLKHVQEIITHKFDKSFTNINTVKLNEEIKTEND